MDNRIENLLKNLSFKDEKTKTKIIPSKASNIDGLLKSPKPILAIPVLFVVREIIPEFLNPTKQMKK